MFPMLTLYLGIIEVELQVNTFLTFKWPAYANASEKQPLEIYFMYLYNKEISCIFKTCCIISVLFFTKCSLCHSFIFHCLFFFLSVS
jgi:hypothetical protein